MKVITTLAEKDYFLGFSAFLNSLVRHGPYVDTIIVGYRGELPGWFPELTQFEFGEKFTSRSGIEIQLVKLSGHLHMVHEKPNWLRYISTVIAPGASEYYFFDSDVVINTRMTFFGEWLTHGVAVCGDVNFPFHRSHPHRKTWAGYAKAAGHEILNEMDGYYNSGFLGWTADTQGFIDDWNDAFAMMAPHSGDMTKFRVYDRSYPVKTTNQDSLNLALMITDQPYSLLGPEAMGFVPGLKLMYHPIGPKPWRRNFFLDFFRGRPPRESDVIYWKNVNGSELAPFSSLKVKLKVFSSKFFRFTGRFYKGQ